MLTLSNGHSKIAAQAFRLACETVFPGVGEPQQSTVVQYDRQITVHRPCVDARSWLKERGKLGLVQACPMAWRGGETWREVKHMT
jgi:hypothetical protein